MAYFAQFEDQDPDKVAALLQQALPAHLRLPKLERAFRAGDGTYLSFEGLWFELRASGTDAVLRYYMEGRDQDIVAALNEAFTEIKI